MSTVLVEYVGKKPREVDHLYGTGIVWLGGGDIQPVPIEAWERMRVHTDVWRAAQAREQAEEAPADEHKPPAPPLDLMSDIEVRDYVKQVVGKTLHHKLTGDNLRKRAVEVLQEG